MSGVTTTKAGRHGRNGIGRRRRGRRSFSGSGGAGMTAALVPPAAAGAGSRLTSSVSGRFPRERPVGSSDGFVRLQSLVYETIARMSGELTPIRTRATFLQRLALGVL